MDRSSRTYFDRLMSFSIYSFFTVCSLLTLAMKGLARRTVFRAFMKGGKVFLPGASTNACKITISVVDYDQSEKFFLYKSFQAIIQKGGGSGPEKPWQPLVTIGANSIPDSKCGEDDCVCMLYIHTIFCLLPGFSYPAPASG